MLLSPGYGVHRWYQYSSYGTSRWQERLHQQKREGKSISTATMVDKIVCWPSHVTRTRIFQLLPQQCENMCGKRFWSIKDSLVNSWQENGCYDRNGTLRNINMLCIAQYL